VVQTDTHSKTIAKIIAPTSLFYCGKSDFHIENKAEFFKTPTKNPFSGLVKRVF
jgi:hypothetical protein